MESGRYNRKLYSENNNKASIKTCLALADSFVSDQPDESEKVLAKISAIIERFGNREENIRYRLLQAKILSSHGEHVKAMDELYSLNIQNEKDINTKIAVDVFLTLSTVEMLSGQYSDSIKNGKKTLSLAKNIDDKEKSAHAFVTIAQSELAIGQLKSAKKNSHTAFKLFSELNNFTRMAIALNTLAGSELALNRPESARRYYCDALHCLENVDNTKKQKVYATILNNLVNVQMLFCEYSNAIINLKKAFAVFKENNDAAACSTILVNMGTVYLQINNIFESLSCLYEAHEIAKQNNIEYLISGIEANLAAVLVQIGDYTKAMSLLKNALIMAKKYSLSRQECHILISLGKVYQKMHNKKSALKMFYAALKLSERQDDKSIISIVRIALGDFYGQCGEWHDGALQYLIAVELLSELKAVRYVAEAYSGAARCFLEMGQKDTAKGYIESAMEYVKTVHEKLLIISMYENATIIYEACGETPKAVKNFKQYLKLSDEFEKEKNISDILTLHVEKEKKSNDSQLSELSLELKRIHKENEVLKRELRLQTLRNVHNKEILEQIRKEVHTESVNSDEIVKRTFGILRTTDRSEHLWASLQNELRRTDPDLTNVLLREFPSLTKMELKVCSLIVLGISSKNIASMLFVEKITIDKHRQNIRKKMKMEANDDIALFLEKLTMSRIS